MTMQHPRLELDRWPAAVYAIGDVHGCLDHLRALEKAIIEDGAEIPGEKLIITLGDHIDRGPDSAGVIEHVLSEPPDGFRRVALLGNHEQLMLRYLDNPPAGAQWLQHGGRETLASYDILGDTEDRHWGVRGTVNDLLAARVPHRHRRLLGELALYVKLPGWLFVHAGILPGIALAHQDPEDLTWIRKPFLKAALPAGLKVVHGHTPGRDPVVTPYRIGIDTHCYARGRLTALRVTPDGATQFLSVGDGLMPPEPGVS
jgi:serine/threonine protein phosphatase 1